MQQNTPSLPEKHAAYPRRRFATFRAVYALILREMATTYGKSPGGYIWAVLEPAGGIALLTFVFSVAFASPPLGINFAMFYATGMVPFMMYLDISGKVATSLLFSKQLLAYPSVTFVDALLGRGILSLLTQLMVGYVIFAGIMLTMETRVIPNYLIIIQAFVLMGAIGIGTGVMNAFMFTRFPIWQRSWSVMMRPMFIISGIFMLPESIPQPYRDIMMYNPLVHPIGLMRRGFYSSYDAADISVLYVICFSGVTLLIGLVFLKRYHRDLLHNT